MYSASISKTIQVELKDGFKSQPISITAFNDFKNFTFVVDVVNSNDDKDELLFIIIVSIAALFIILFGGYLFSIVRKRQKTSAMPE